MDSVGSPNSALKKGFAYRHPIQPQPKQAAQPIQHIRYVLTGRSVSPHFCTAAHLPDNHKWSSQYHRKVQGIQHHSRSRQFYSFFFISLLLVYSSLLNFSSQYIMCAADLALRPRGSLVESSLGTCIVADTGDFIYANPTQIDIAVDW